MRGGAPKGCWGLEGGGEQAQQAGSDTVTAAVGAGAVGNKAAGVGGQAEQAGFETVTAAAGALGAVRGAAAGEDEQAEQAGSESVAVAVGAGVAGGAAAGVGDEAGQAGAAPVMMREGGEGTMQAGCEVLSAAASAEGVAPDPAAAAHAGCLALLAGHGAAGGRARCCCKAKLNLVGG